MPDDVRHEEDGGERGGKLTPRRRLAWRFALRSGFPSAASFLRSISTEDWQEAVEFFNACPFGPDVEARQRADILAALHAIAGQNGAEGVTLDPERILESWGYCDDAWQDLTDEELYDQTQRGVFAAFGR